MTAIPFTQVAHMLSISSKTLRQWLKDSHLELFSHPTDARVKCLTIEQVQQLATLHGRSLKQDAVSARDHAPLAVPESATEGQPESVVTPTQLMSKLPATVGDAADIVSSLSELSATVASLQQQVAELALSLVHERELRYERRLSTLETLMQQPAKPSVDTQEVEVQALVSMSDGPSPTRRCLNPAELRARSRVISLIEYGTHDNYVIISPQEGELFFAPDSPEWFDWLACLSSFRFMGQLGRFTAYRDSRRSGPTRRWSAVRCIHGHPYKCYLGTTDHLTISVLEQAAVTLQSHISSL
jgi:hypothetical protein